MEITEESFDALLSWLDPDRETAGRKYEQIRSGLIRIFVSKGFNNAEDLADECINRVMRRLPEIQNEYVGEPARYFYGVARNIILEQLKRKETASADVLVVVDPPGEDTTEQECLRKCLDILVPQKRDLILDYYLYTGHEKVEHHKQMAALLTITEGALRGRAHQIRGALEKCVRQCSENRELKQKPSYHHIG